MITGNAKYDIMFHDRKNVGSNKYMCCPACGFNHSSVHHPSASVHQQNGLKGVGRERRCSKCKTTWRTLEIPEWEF